MKLFGRLFSENAKPNRNEESRKLEFLPYAVSTTTAVQKMMEAEDGRFELYAGAVLAIHQDTKAFLEFDMAFSHNDYNIISEFAQDKTRIHRFGNYADRFSHSLKAMGRIESQSLKIIDEIDEVNIEKRKAEIIYSYSNLFASRVWNITLMSKTEGFEYLSMSAETLWISLGMVPKKIVIDKAMIFTGSYYDGVSCDSFNIDFWPSI